MRRTPVTEAMEAHALELELRVLKIALASMHDLSLASTRLLQRIRRIGTMNAHTSIDTTWLPIYPQPRSDRDGLVAPPRSGQILGGGLIKGYAPVVQKADVQHELNSHEWSGFKDLPTSLSSYLINLFLPYRSQFFFFTDIPQFLRCLSYPPSHPEAIHPCLLNACYLGACAGTGGVLAALQPLFIERTRHFLDQALMFADRITQFLWASVVLGSHLGRGRRLEEAFVVVSAAARFASACGLIRGIGAETDSERRTREYLLPPPKDPAEAIERLRLAHSIYLLDQMLAALTGYPTTFSYENQLRLPSEQAGFLHIQSNEKPSPVTDELARFWGSDIHLKVSIARTFERVKKLAASFRDDGYHAIENEYIALGYEISSQHESIPPLSDPRGLRPSEKVSSFNPHILLAHFTLYGAGLILWSLRAHDDGDARRKMLGCLHQLVRICEMTRGRQHLHLVQHTMFSLLHIRNAVRAIARELLLAEVRRNTALATNYCSVIESLLDFLDDMTLVYKEWGRFIHTNPSLLRHCLPSTWHSF
ncbi:hypothetical protein DL93DRAFT_215850 [Clavulina sp. PMI_390]|nr:hypothetical protein DL93DRAFT_215850 [Clavulina sp. PMI_390]